MVVGCSGMDAILEKVTSKDEMFTVLDRAYTQHQLQPSLKCIVVLTKLSPERLTDLPREETFKRYSFKVERIEKEVYKVHAQREWAERTFKAFFIVLKGEDYWVILTTERKNITEGLIETFLRELYPAVIRIYLNNLQLRVLLQGTAESYQADLDLTFMAYTEESPNKLLQISARGKGLTTTDETIRQLNRVEFVLTKSGYETLRCVVTTRGLVRLLYGSFWDFYKLFLLRIVELIKSWDSKYLAVQRIYSTEGPQLTSCVIRYSRPPSLREVRTLASRIVSKYPAVVSHAGNPYFVAQVSDPRNKASFGLTLYGDTLTIVPVSAGSETPSASLWALTQEVQDSLGEGEIIVR